MTDTTTQQGREAFVRYIQSTDNHRPMLISEVWKDVRIDGLPDCDGVTVYVGENEAGFIGCFNEMSGDACVMTTPESYDTVMSCLRYWRVQDRPNSPPTAARSLPPTDAARVRELRNALRGLLRACKGEGPLGTALDRADAALARQEGTK